MGMEGLDAWITGHWGQDAFPEMVCPKCGANSEDFYEFGNGNPEMEDYDYQCRECDAFLYDDDLVSRREWVVDNDPRRV